MKSFLLSLIALLFTTGTTIHASVWLWASKAESTNSEMADIVKSDNSGNMYIGGSFSGTMTFGATTLTCTGTQNIFVAKMNSQGQWLWASKGPQATLNDMVIDNSGNAVLVGNFRGTQIFGSTTLTPPLNPQLTDVFIAKMNSSGSWVWAKRAGGFNDDSGNGIAIDTSGNTYVTGRVGYATGIDFGSITFDSAHSDSFVSKLNASGTFQWVKRIVGTENGSASGLKIKLDSSGNLVYLCSYNGSLAIGGTTITSSSIYSYFVVKQNPTSGSFFWCKPFSGIQPYPSFEGSPDGSFVIAGSIYDCATFGVINVLQNNPNGNSCVAKLTSNGSWSWGVRGTGSVLGLSVGSDNKIYTCGSASGSSVYPAIFGDFSFTNMYGLYVGQLDSSGVWTGIKYNSSYSTNAAPYAMFIDNQQNPIITGIYSMTAVFGDFTLTCDGNSAIFVAKLNGAIMGVFPPLPPVADPATNITNDSFQANWSASTGATSYRLDVSVSSYFGSFVTGYNNLTVNSTSFNVTGLIPDTIYYYRVRGLNESGTSLHSNTISVPTSVSSDDPYVEPGVTKLIECYPNPFNPETTIRYSLKASGYVDISIFNVRGQLVKVINNEILGKGMHTVTWNGLDDRNLPVHSGLYYIRMSTPEGHDILKATLMK